MFDSINRSGGDISPNLDGADLVVVEHSNLVEDVGDTELYTEEPAPQPDERVHYRTFVEEMAEMFETRFL